MSSAPAKAVSEAPPPLQHLAVIMDGNGRWAQRQGKSRSAGHKAGQQALEKLVEHCGNLGIPVLTVFAFSSENWKRPRSEVKRLLDLFLRALDRKVKELHENGARLRFIGNLGGFSTELQNRMQEAESLTADNHRLIFNIAVNYGGRWDITRAAKRLAEKAVRGDIDPQDIDIDSLAGETSLAGLPEPDLLIRTGGDQRISNFLLWQFAYTEILFTPTLWPDYRPEDLDLALAEFSQRERRYGGVNNRPALARAN